MREQPVARQASTCDTTAKKPRRKAASWRPPTSFFKIFKMPFTIMDSGSHERRLSRNSRRQMFPINRPLFGCFLLSEELFSFSGVLSGGGTPKNASLPAVRLDKMLLISLLSGLSSLILVNCFTASAFLRLCRMKARGNTSHSHSPV